MLFVSIWIIFVIGHCISSTDPKALIARTLGRNTSQKEPIPSEVIQEITNEWVRWPSPESTMNELIDGIYKYEVMWRMRSNDLIADKLSQCNGILDSTSGGETSLTFVPCPLPSGNIYEIHFVIRSPGKPKITVEVTDKGVKGQNQRRASMELTRSGTAYLKVTKQNAVWRSEGVTRKTRIVPD